MRRNYRHAAALTLVVWYLMAPPPNTDPKRPKALIDGTAPISRWGVLGEFETERDCETAHDILRDEVRHSKLNTKTGWPLRHTLRRSWRIARRPMIPT